MASDSQKTDLLFKEFTGVVNTNQSGTFAQEDFAFQDFIFNDGVLSNEIPVDLSDISLNGVYGVAALDASFAQNGATLGDTYAIPNTDLVFYYKRLLQKAYVNSNRSWYVPDASDSTISDLKGTIPFKYDANYDSYRQNLWNNAGTSAQGLYNTPLYWLMDYKSGFVEFYGDENVVNGWVSSFGPPRFSYIRYEGPRGAGSGGIAPGSDASFNVLEATDISCDNLLVRDQALLPAETLIVPRNHLNIHPAGYPLTTTYDSVLVSANAPGNLVVGDWVSIAKVGREGIVSNQSIRGDARFQIISHQSGIQDELQFTVTIKYSRAMIIDIHEETSYSSSYRTFDAIRIAYNEGSGSQTTGTNVGTYDGCVLQLRVGFLNSSDNRVQIRISNNNNYTGWESYLPGLTSTYIVADNTPVVLVENTSRNEAFWNDGTGGYSSPSIDQNSYNPAATGLKGNPFANEVFMEVFKRDTSNSNNTLTLHDNYESKAHNTTQLVQKLATRPNVKRAIPSPYVEPNNLGIWSLTQTATATIHLEDFATYDDKWYQVCKIEDLTQIGGGSGGTGSSLAFPATAFTLSLIGWQNYDDVGFNAANQFSFDITIDVVVRQNGSTSGGPSHDVWFNTTRWVHAQKKTIDNIAAWYDNGYIYVGFHIKTYQPGSTYQQTGKYLYIETFITNNGNNALVLNHTGSDPTNTGTDPKLFRQLRAELVSDELTAMGSVPASLISEIGSMQGTFIASSGLTVIQTDTYLPGGTFIDGERLKYTIETPTQFRPTFDQTGNWIPLAQVFAYTNAVDPSAPSQNVVTASMSFRLEASDDFYDTQNHSRVQLVYGAITVCGATANGGQRKVTIDIHRSVTSGDGALTNPHALIKRVFVTGQTNGSLQEYSFFVEVDDGVGNNIVPYFRIDMTDNGANNGAFTGANSVNENTWVANGDFNVSQGSVGTPIYEVNINSGSFAHLSEDVVEIGNDLSVDNDLSVGNDVNVTNDVSISGALTMVNPSGTPGVPPAYNIDNSTGSLNTQELYINGVQFVPDGYALVETTTFTLDAGFADGDWLSIAQAGDGTNRNALRAEGLFVIHERSGSHHHSVVMRIGAKFSSGFYINVDSSTWYNTARILQARIMYSSTYDGSVFQLKLKNTGSGTFYLSHYQNTDEHGWNILANGTGLLSTNSPVVYVTDNPSNPTGTPYISSRETRQLDWDPNGRNSMATTTKDHSFYEGIVEVNSGALNLETASQTINDGYLNVICNAPGSAGIDIDGSTGNHPTFNMKEGSNFSVKVTEVAGDIELDNTASGTGSTISLRAGEQLVLQSLSTGTTAGVFVMGSGNTFYVNGSGFDMNGKNVVGATTMESNTFTRNSSSTLTIGEISTATSGNYINLNEPTLIYRTTNSNGSNYLNNLGGGAFPTAANGIQFFDSGSTNQFPVQRRGFSSLPTPLYTNWAQTSPYRFDCVIATSIRNGTTVSNKQLNSTVSYLEHASSDGWSAYEVSNTGQGSSVFLTRHLMSFDCLLRAVTVQTMGIYCSISNTTGSSVIVDFELWVTYEDGAATGTPTYFTHSFFYATGWPGDMLPTDIKNNNINSNYARKIKTRTETIPNGSSQIYNPFLTGNNTFKPELLAIDPPLYVPKDKVAIVHAVERRVSNISSGNVEFTTYAYGLGGTGHASAAMICNVVGEMNFNS